MKNHYKIIVTIITLLAIALGTTGCWNRRELPTLAIVLGVGVDRIEDTGKLKLTAQIVKTATLKTSSTEDSSSGSSGDAFWNATNTGDSMFETVRDFTHKTNRKLYWPHNQVIIFGHSLAEKGVQQYIDFFIRDQEPRLGVWVLVADDKASDVLDVKPKLEKIPAVNLADLMEDQSASSQTSVIKLYEFITRLMSQTTAPIAPIVEVQGKGNDKELIVTGTAVFKRDQLIGKLDKEETRGLLWVIDKVKSGIIDVNCPDSDAKVNLEIIRTKGKFTSEIIDNKPYIKVDIKEEGNIASQSCSDSLVSPATVAALEAEQANAIKEEIKAALSKAQKLNADIFGFGDAIHQRHPSEWKEMKTNWNELFPDLEVEINVEAKLRRSGIIGQPPAPEKEK
ncbi:Ger(x)C family spore germination protein [Desulfosporosinus sp. Sb-LF]|uniref:Ger(x)C family spore germination protein n=1 Tax=Desulfosporosinus sp. Sb-LF TaxID=2560027 RepID=UPI00107F4661|nr:Ger(x)C family spore germination protein [Desulfosporosinus sp. Sb-LF]TGE34604.1 Ger(x)C family spore germination protein [Desulfosporosinus sp. Sb-LF]